MKYIKTTITISGVHVYNMDAAMTCVAVLRPQYRTRTGPSPGVPAVSYGGRVNRNGRRTCSLAHRIIVSDERWRSVVGTRAMMS